MEEEPNIFRGLNVNPYKPQKSEHGGGNVQKFLDSDLYSLPYKDGDSDKKKLYDQSVTFARSISNDCLTLLKLFYDIAEDEKKIEEKVELSVHLMKALWAIMNNLKVINLSFVHDSPDELGDANKLWKASLPFLLFLVQSNHDVTSDELLRKLICWRLKNYIPQNVLLSDTIEEYTKLDFLRENARTDFHNIISVAKLFFSDKLNKVRKDIIEAFSGSTSYSLLKINRDILIPTIQQNMHSQLVILFFPQMHKNVFASLNFSIFFDNMLDNIEKYQAFS